MWLFSTPGFSRLIIIVFVSITSFNLASSQDLEEEFQEFMEEIEDEFNEAKKSQKDEFNSFILERNKEFSDFLLKADKNFSDFLRKEWIEINNLKYNQRDKSNMPEFEKKYTNQKYNPHTRHIETISSISPIINDWLNSSYSLQTKKENTILKKISLDFYGTKLNIAYDPDILSNRNLEISNHEIANFWEKSSATYYSKTIRDLYEVKEQINLNDWGFFKLVDNLCNKLTSDINKQQLLKWFFLSKSGYYVKLGIENNSLHLALATNDKIYDVPGFELNNSKFIIINTKPDKIKTYPSFNTHGRPFSFYQQKPLSLPNDTGVKKIKLSYGSKIYSFEIPYNKNLIDFYKTHPQSELGVYTNSYLSAETRDYLASQIKPITDSFNYEKKVEFLNNFVQQISKYKTDKEQFGIEKHYFPEETLYYSFSDCEDRVILLSFLLKQLTQTECIAADYKGHIVIGLPADSIKTKGNRISFEKTDYLLLDPTFIGAPLGIISSDINNIQPIIYELFYSNQAEKENELKNKLEANCIVEDVFTNKKGETYYTGFATTDLKINDLHLTTNPNSSNSFVLKHNTNSKFEVIYRTQDNGKEKIHAISENKKGEIFMLGSFRDTLKIKDKSIFSENQEMFLMKWNKSYEVEWLKNLNLSRFADSINNFTTIYNTQGNLLYLGTNNNSNKHKAFQFEFDSAGNCIIMGASSFAGILSIDTISFESGNNFEIMDWLIKENSRLIKARFNPEISPLFAVMNIITSSNIRLSGTSLHSALMQMYVGNKQKKVVIPEDITGIETLMQQNGFVTILTKGRTPVKLKNLIISNETRIKIAEEEHESRMLIYSGVKWESSSTHHSVNYIVINKETGDIYYNYDQNYRKRLPGRQLTIH